MYYLSVILLFYLPGFSILCAPKLPLSSYADVLAHITLGSTLSHGWCPPPNIRQKSSRNSRVVQNPFQTLHEATVAQKLTFSYSDDLPSPLIIMCHKTQGGFQTCWPVTTSRFFRLIWSKGIGREEKTSKKQVCEIGGMMFFFYYCREHDNDNPGLTSKCGQKKLCKCLVIVDSGKVSTGQPKC